MAKARCGASAASIADVRVASLRQTATGEGGRSSVRCACSSGAAAAGRPARHADCSARDQSIEVAENPNGSIGTADLAARTRGRGATLRFLRGIQVEVLAVRAVQDVREVPRGGGEARIRGARAVQQRNGVPCSGCALPAKCRHGERVQRASVLGRRAHRVHRGRERRVAVRPGREHRFGASELRERVARARAAGALLCHEVEQRRHAIAERVLLHATMAGGSDALAPRFVGKQCERERFEVVVAVEHALFAVDEEVAHLEVLALHHEQRAAGGDFECAEVHLAADRTVPADARAAEEIAVCGALHALVHRDLRAARFEVAQPRDPRRAFALHRGIEVACERHVEVARQVRRAVVERPLPRVLAEASHVGVAHRREQFDAGRVAQQHVEERLQPRRGRQRQVVVRHDADGRHGAVLQVRGQRFLVRPPQQHEIRLEAVRQRGEQLLDRLARRVERDVEREVHAVDHHAVWRSERAELDTAQVLAVVEALQRQVAEDAHGRRQALARASRLPFASSLCGSRRSALEKCARAPSRSPSP